MFFAERCDECGKCLAQCRFLDFDEAAGGEAVRALKNGESPEWLNQCITCFACDETCPAQANPSDLIIARMEASGAYLDPALVSAMHGHFSPKGDFTAPKVSGRVVSLCTIYSVLPPETFDGPLFQGVSLLKGRFFFCHILYPHLGNLSLFEAEAPGFIQRLADTGADEIVFVHADCFAAIRKAREMGIEIPFKALHLFDHILDYLDRHPDEISPLNLDVAYQRPCASRLAPEKEPVLDEIFKRIGVNRVAREFDRENALCCGENTGGAIPARKVMPEWQQKNIDDAKAHNASIITFLCPMCQAALSGKAMEAGLEPLFITDLVNRALA